MGTYDLMNKHEVLPRGPGPVRCSACGSASRRLSSQTTIFVSKLIIDYFVHEWH